MEKKNDENIKTDNSLTKEENQATEAVQSNGIQDFGV